MEKSDVPKSWKLCRMDQNGVLEHILIDWALAQPPTPLLYDLSWASWLVVAAWQGAAWLGKTWAPPRLSQG